MRFLRCLLKWFFRATYVIFVMGVSGFVGAFVASWDARRRGRVGGARPRLRSGAFAPDCPLVIFVAAYGRCLQIPSGASRLRATHPTPTTSCAVLVCALLERDLLTRFTGPAECGRGSGALSAYASHYVGAGVACALVGSGFLLAPAVKWGRWSDGWPVNVASVG